MRAAVQELTVDVSSRRRWDHVDVRVLHDVSLRLVGGQMTALVGESGCGKSMVASALTGLLPPGARTGGAVIVDGVELGPDDPRWSAVRGHRVGLVPQSPATSFTPVRTVGSQLDEVVRTLDGTRSSAELGAAVRLEPGALDLYPHELSGGMAQRAALAAALAGDPAVIIADEPTSALDRELAGAAWELLASAARDGAAVLVITHDIDALSDGGCDAVAVMRAGRVVTQGSPEEMLGSSDAYVGGLFEPVS
ncbi:ATP-binding cassette domain-containing protein [Gordonia sesuvii]|uniref:ATP-binding cassette domain-containing protein n=1 Tax=Gordonia sesuvii TaxID=3116777 RepID=UPI003D67D48A